MYDLKRQTEVPIKRLADKKGTEKFLNLVCLLSRATMIFQMLMNILFLSVSPLFASLDGCIYTYSVQRKSSNEPGLP